MIFWKNSNIMTKTKKTAVKTKPSENISKNSEITPKLYVNTSKMNIIGKKSMI